MLLSKLIHVVALWVLTLPSLVSSAWYEDNSHVRVISSLEDMESTVLTSDGLWMIQFCTANDDVCLKMSPNYSMIASLYKGIIHLGVVDVETPEGKQIVQRFGIPTDKIPIFYWFLDDKSKPSKVDSSNLEMENMVRNIMSTMASAITERAQSLGMGVSFSNSEKDSRRQSNNDQKQKRGKHTEKMTVTVTGDDEWQEKVINSPLVTLVAFAAPWCGHCKMLQPEFDEAAAKLQGQGAQLVWIDATDEANANLAQAYNVKGFPTMYIFPGGAPKSKSQARQYPGERKASAIVKYVLGEVDVSGTPKEIPQLIGQEVLDAECKGTNHICVLAALPHILDSGAAGRNNYKDVVTKVSKTFRGGAFSFLWFQGGDQPALESALELTFGFPAVVAYSMDRHAFAVLHGSFSEKSITSFLHGVTTGRVPVVKLAQEKVPKIESTEPWDGLDAAAPEEEFSLDDIMGDDFEPATKDGADEL